MMKNIHKLPLFKLWLFSGAFVVGHIIIKGCAG
jgi:hypothetical protein